MRTAILKLLLLWLVLPACEQEPTNPDEYLQEFRSFTEMIEQDYPDYNDRAQLRADATFLYFSRDLYNHFYDDMTIEERQASWTLRLRYLNMKIKVKAKNTWEELEDYFLSSR